MDTGSILNFFAPVSSINSLFAAISILSPGSFFPPGISKVSLSLCLTNTSLPLCFAMITANFSLDSGMESSSQKLSKSNCLRLIRTPSFLLSLSFLCRKRSKSIILYYFKLI